MRVYKFCCSGNCPEIREADGVITLVDDFDGSVSMLKDQWVRMAEKWMKGIYSLPMTLAESGELFIYDYVDSSLRVKMQPEEFDALVKEFFKVCEACPV